MAIPKIRLLQLEYQRLQNRICELKSQIIYLSTQLPIVEAISEEEYNSVLFQKSLAQDDLMSAQKRLREIENMIRENQGKSDAV